MEEQPVLSSERRNYPGSLGVLAKLVQQERAGAGCREPLAERGKVPAWEGSLGSWGRARRGLMSLASLVWGVQARVGGAGSGWDMVAKLGLQDPLGLRTGCWGYLGDPSS